MRISDWSSDVCSSDLSPAEAFPKSLCLRLERSADREHDAVLRNLAGRAREHVVTLADAGVDIGHAEVKRLPACRSADRPVAVAAVQAAERTDGVAIMRFQREGRFRNGEIGKASWRERVGQDV